MGCIFCIGRGSGFKQLGWPWCASQDAGQHLHLRPTDPGPAGDGPAALYRRMAWEEHPWHVDGRFCPSVHQWWFCTWYVYNYYIIISNIGLNIIHSWMIFLPVFFFPLLHVLLETRPSCPKPQEFEDCGETAPETGLHLIFPHASWSGVETGSFFRWIVFSAQCQCQLISSPKQCRFDLVENHIVANSQSEGMAACRLVQVDFMLDSFYWIIS